MPLPPEITTAPQSMADMLFYFVCVLSSVIAGSFVWFAKYIMLPLRDGHLDYLRHSKAFMDKMDTDNEKRDVMHQQNLTELREIYKLSQEINGKIKCPVIPHQNYGGR